MARNFGMLLGVCGLVFSMASKAEDFRPNRSPWVSKRIQGVGSCSISPAPGKIIIRDEEGKVLDSAESLIDAEELEGKISRASNEVSYRMPRRPGANVLIEAGVGDGKPVQLYSTKTQTMKTGAASNWLLNLVKGLCAGLGN